MKALIPLLALATSSCAVFIGSDGWDGRRKLVHAEAEGALGPYSGHVRAGDLVFVSGKIGEGGGTFEHEAATAIDRVAAELARARLSLDDVVSATVYLTDMELYGAFNAIYAARFPAPYPARACVEVGELPGGARVEIVVTARR